MKEKIDLHALFQKKTLVICASLFLIGVLLLSAFGTKREENEKTVSESFDENAYTQALETRLEEHLRALSGVGEVRVMLTLDTTGSQNYSRDSVSEHSAGESAESGRENSSLVLQSGKNGVKSPILESVCLPRVRGVCVIASGAGTPAIQLKITSAIQALLGIRTNQISVIA